MCDLAFKANEDSFLGGGDTGIDIFPHTLVTFDSIPTDFLEWLSNLLFTNPCGIQSGRA